MVYFKEEDPSLVCTFRTEFKSRAVNRTGVVISGFMDGVVKGHRPHNVDTGPGSVGRMVLHFLDLGAWRTNESATILVFLSTFFFFC